MKQQYPSHQINELDGLKMFFAEDLWILFPPSASVYRNYDESKIKKNIEKGLEEVMEDCSYD